MFAGLFLRQLNIIMFLIAIFAFAGFMGFFMYIWNTYAKGIGSPEWIMVQFSRVGRKTGQTVKREVRKTESMIRHFSQSIAIRKKTKLEQMEDFLEEEKKKKLKKVKKKDRKKKIKAVHKQMVLKKEKNNSYFSLFFFKVI